MTRLAWFDSTSSDARETRTDLGESFFQRMAIARTAYHLADNAVRREEERSRKVEP